MGVSIKLHLLAPSERSGTRDGLTYSKIKQAAAHPSFTTEIQSMFGTCSNSHSFACHHCRNGNQVGRRASQREHLRWSVIFIVAQWCESRSLSQEPNANEYEMRPVSQATMVAEDTQVARNASIL